jgi:hypothetical protein
MRLLRTGDDDEEDHPGIPGQSGGVEPSNGIVVPPSPVPMPLPAVLPILQPQLAPLAIEEDAEGEDFSPDVGPPIPFIPVALFAKQDSWREQPVEEESSNKPAFGGDSSVHTQERESFAFSTNSDFTYHPPTADDTQINMEWTGKADEVKPDPERTDLVEPVTAVISTVIPPTSVNEGVPPVASVTVVPSVILEPLPPSLGKRPPAGPTSLPAEKQKTKKTKPGLFGSRKKASPSTAASDGLTSPVPVASLGLTPSPWMGISLEDEPEQGIVMAEVHAPPPPRIMEPPRGDPEFTASHDDQATSLTTDAGKGAEGKKPKRSKKIRFVDSDEGTPSIEPVSAGRKAQPAPFRLDSATSLDSEVDLAMNAGPPLSEPFALPPRATAVASIGSQMHTTSTVAPLFGAQPLLVPTNPNPTPRGLPPRPTKLAFMGKKSKKQKPTSQTSAVSQASSLQDLHQPDSGRPSGGMGMEAEMLQLEDVEDWE